jgi:parvulin-like peptidyl-prolyl isomerase
MCFILFLFSLVFCLDGTVLMIENRSYSLHDFFSRYPKKQWDRTDSLQKEKMLSDFIDRELCVIEAKNLGFQNDPSIAVKIFDRSLQILVNESYEYFVARPLLPEESLNQTRLNSKKEVFVSHILVGHSGSYLGTPPQRTIDDALVLIQKIKGDYDNGSDFAVLAEKYSDDPGVALNSGEVGWVPWGATVPEFQNMAFSLDMGALSSPVLTDFGYHLILASDTRASEYQYMHGNEYENLVINITKNSIREKLRPAAIEYDNNMIDLYGVVFNIEAVRELLGAYVEQQNISVDGASNSTDSFFGGISRPIVVCVYNKKGYGPGWFARRLARSPASRLPNFKTVDDVLSIFKTYILQDIAINKGLEVGVDSLFSYRKKVDDMVSAILYDAYLKHLIDLVPSPDSSSVREYYNANKYEDYMEEEKITVREIKVVDRMLADSLLVQIHSGVDFSSLARKHSLVSPESGGIYGPFSKKQANNYFNASSLLKIGDVSPVISSSNSSFSIIQLIDRFPSSPLGLELVYARIQSLLLKDAQDLSKKQGVGGLLDKYAVIRKTSLLY